MTEPLKPVTNVEHKAGCPDSNNTVNLYLSRQIALTSHVYIESDDDGPYMMPPEWDMEGLLEPVTLECRACLAWRYVVLDRDGVPVELTTANCPRTGTYLGHYGKKPCKYCGKS